MWFLTVCTAYACFKWPYDNAATAYETRMQCLATAIEVLKIVEGTAFCDKDK